MSAFVAAGTWSIGLWRLASGRIRDDWRFLIGVWFLLACATSLLASGVVYGDAVAVGSLRSSIRAAPPAEQTILVQSVVSPDRITAADKPVRDGLDAVLGGVGGSVGLELRSGALFRVGEQAPAEGPRTLTVLESVDDLARHATLSSGRWPTAGRAPLEAAVTMGAASTLGLAVGDTVGFADASTPGADANKAIATVVIVGIYEPTAGDVAWAGDGLDLTGAGTINGGPYEGPFVVDRVDLVAVAPGRLDARWRAVPDLDGLTADDIGPLRLRLDAMPAQIRGVFPAGGSVNVSLELGKRLDALGRTLEVARGAVLVLTLQFAVVAAYAVLLVSGMLADRRRPEVGLLRSRGASTGHVAALALGEAILLVIPAVAVAPFVGAGLVRLLGRVGPLATTGVVADAAPSATGIAILVVTGAILALILALPALTSGAEVAGIRALLGRPVARTLAERLGIDLALAAVAAIAIWQLRTYGQPLTRDARGTLGLDPLLVAAPTFGLVAGGIIATRLVPRLGEIGEGAMSRLPGLTPPLAARQIARRPLRYTRAALLLILASALGTFGAAYATTWSGSHADQAAYQVGADVRVVPGSGLAAPGWSLGSAYRAVSGVAAVTPVGRTDLAVGTVVRSGALLDVDASAVGDIATLPPSGRDSIPAGLAALVAARPKVALVQLPPNARWLRIHFDSKLTEQGIDFGDGAHFEVPDDYRGVQVAAVIRDADGTITTFQPPETDLKALFKGDNQVLRVAIADPRAPDRAPTEPRALLGLELSLTNPFGFFANPIQGSIHVTGIDGGARDAGSWQPLDLAPASGWTWQEEDASGTLSRIATGLDPFDLPSEGRFASPGDVLIRFVPPQPADTSLPAIAGEQLLALTGSDVDQTLNARSSSAELSIRVVGRMLEFPTLKPSVGFAVVDGPTRSLLDYLAGRSAAAVPEWWIRTQPGSSSAVADTIRASSPHSATVMDAAMNLASLEADPIGLGTLGALLLGSLAAAAFAVLGFLVGAWVAARERVTEFALLRALGLSRGQLTRWLAVESAFILGLGVLAGTGIGLLLAWLIVPATLLGANGEPVVPVPTLGIPWGLVGLVYLAAIPLLALSIAIVRGALPGRNVATILRAAEE